MTRREAIKRTSLLVGGGLSAAVVTGVMSGCQATGAPDWQPQVLQPEQAMLLESVTDIILPATDTPGAKELHVAEFIDLMLKDCYNKTDQEKFKSGLDDLAKAGTVAFNKPFGKCTAEQQLELVNTLDRNTFGAEVTDNQEQARFYRTLKSLTLLGYFTAEPVMTQQL
ncbi:MAG: gluconate 2-dehydrogenase subunit 3 family protein, partial [Bacteroidota bacterium]